MFVVLLIDAVFKILDGIFWRLVRKRIIGIVIFCYRRIKIVVIIVLIGVFNRFFCKKLIFKIFLIVGRL